jgi:hypothetical protein
MPHPKVKISDNDGNTVAIDTSGASNALKVALVDSDDIDIGNVVLQSSGGSNIAALTANADTLDLDGHVLLGTHSLLSARKDVDTTVGITCEDSTHNALHVAISDGAGIANVNSANELEVSTNQAIGATGFAGPAKVLSIGGTTSLGTIQELLADAQGHLQVDVLTLPASTNTIEVVGDVAEDVNAAGNPVLVGGRYDNSDRTLDDTDVGAIALTAKGIVKISVEGTGTTSLKNVGAATASAGQHGVVSLARMNDAVSAPSGHGDNEWSFLQTNLLGALYTTGGEVEDDAVQSQPLLIGGRYDSSARSLDDGDAGAIALNASGHMITTHGIAGLASDDNDTVGTTAEKISGADGDVACKRVDIMAHPSNTGEIWVGDNAVTTNGANGGIRLLAGDFYSMDIDNTGDVYVVATVDGENVCFNYFT